MPELSTSEMISSSLILTLFGSSTVLKSIQQSQGHLHRSEVCTQYGWPSAILRLCIHWIDSPWDNFWPIADEGYHQVGEQVAEVQDGSNRGQQIAVTSSIYVLMSLTASWLCSKFCWFSLVIFYLHVRFSSSVNTKQKMAWRLVLAIHAGIKGGQSCVWKHTTIPLRQLG